MLAVTSRKRVDIAADVPTVAEAGYPYLGLDSLIGIYGPRGMSDALRDGIAADVRAVVEADPTIASRLAADRPGRRSARPRPNSPPASRKSATSSPRSRKTLGIKAAQQQ